MSSGRRLVRNSIWMTGSVVGGGLLLFANLVLCARYLSVAGFGTFTLVVTLVSIFQLFADGGVVNITIRDVARDLDRRSEILGATRAFVWGATVLLLFVLILCTEALGQDRQFKTVVYLMGISALVALHASLHAGIIRAYEDMGVVAASAFLHKVLLLGLVWAAIHWDTGLEGVAGAHLAANVVQWWFQAGWVRARYTRSRLHLDRAHVRYLLKEAMPLGAGVVLRRLTVHLSTFLLTFLSGVVAVGIFNSAYRFLQMMEIGAISLASVLFPALAKAHQASAVEFARLYENSLRILIVLVAPVAGVLIAFGDQYVLLIYGESYAAAGQVLRVLGASLLFLVPGALAHPVFAALGRQTLFMRLSAFGVGLNALVGAPLIHLHASLGAAWASLGTEIFTFTLGAYLIRSAGVVVDYARGFLRAGLPVLALAFVARELVGSASRLGLILASAGYALVSVALTLAVGAVKLSEVRAALARRRPPAVGNEPVIGAPRNGASAN